MRVRVAALMTASLLAGWLASVASADTSSRELPAPGEDEKLYSCKKSTGSIEITFKPETEVKDLVTWVMGFTCKNFIYAPHIVAQGRKLTIVAPTKMTAQEAYRLFLASLATLNLTVVPQGNIMKIIETNTGKRLPVPLFKSGTPDNTDQLVRYVLRPNYMQADALAKAIGSVKSDPGEITVAGSLLLIVDYGSHVRDMLSIARLVDVPSGSEGVYTLALKHADAAKLLPKLTSILGMEGAAAAGKAAPAPTNEMQAQGVAPSKILVDERTNTLIVAASPAAYERVKALVERLDISLEIEGGSSIHVYPLGSAIAEEVAKTLNEAIQKTQVPSGSTTPARQGSPLPSSSTAGLGEGLDGRAQVVADKPTNKLIVVSSGRDFLAIKEVIKELDQPRRQVYIEALILEVNMSNDRSFGFSVHGGKTVGSTGSTLALGGVQTGSVSSVDPTSLVGATGLVGGLIGSALPGSSDLFGQSIPSFGVLMQAIAHRSNTNILSAPSIIALDNEEAKYKVGTNIPYSKGIIPTTTVTQNSPVSTNVDRKDLVLELKIKPHISTGDQILLEIVHEANDFGEDLALGPSWATRGFETRAVVKDQQTFVLGGLMQEKDIYTSEQVPILGDIPLLGHLFKFSKKTKKKTNLIIMLTPYIIKDDLELEAIRERKMREHQEYTQSQRTFAELRYQPRIDYRRKRGLLEDINRTVEQVEKDLEQLADLRRPEPMKSGPVQVPAQVEGAE